MQDIQKVNFIFTLNEQMVPPNFNAIYIFSTVKKHTQSLYGKNYKRHMEEIGDLNRQRQGMPTGRLNIVKMLIFLHLKRFYLQVPTGSSLRPSQQAGWRILLPPGEGRSLGCPLCLGWHGSRWAVRHLIRVEGSYLTVLSWSAFFWCFG